MTTPTTANLLKYADVQMASEAFLVDAAGAPVDLKTALIRGNDHSSKFTATQADAFIANGWTVLTQKPDTPTGFSGTLFKNNKTDEIVLSIRSTEFIDDAARDNQATNAMEIKNSGWAFGQIRDMEAWYNELAADPAKLQGKAFSVTGYSLGGHLATAFNIMHPGATQQVVTFNGAGVGEIVQTGDGPKTLNSIIIEFNRLAQNANGEAITFTDSDLTALYARIRADINAGRSITADDRAALTALAHPSGGGSTTVPAQTQTQAQKIETAAKNVETIRAEVQRLTKITDGLGTGVGHHPEEVKDEAIGQENLDYQMAVLTVSAYTKSASLIGGATRAYSGKVPSTQFGNPGNQYDVVGDTTPSMVANSQWHIGNEVRVGCLAHRTRSAARKSGHYQNNSCSRTFHEGCRPVLHADIAPIGV